MSSTIEIRAATHADVPRLVPLVEGYWRFEAIEGFDAAQITALLTRVCDDARLGSVWIATIDGAPAGYLLAVFVFSLEHGGLTAEIDEFFVLPGRRGLGVGARMLTTAEARFRIEGCTHMSLQIGRGNEEARRFYRAHGFDDRVGYDLVSKML